MSTINSVIKKNKIILTIIALISLICIGFQVHKVTDPAYRLFQPIANAADSDVLCYNGYSQSIYGIYECSFTVISDNAEGVGDELKLIYDTANQILQSEKNRRCIAIRICVPRPEKGAYQIAAVFRNYEGHNAEKAEVFDHICYVRGVGISSESIYDSDYDYEINHNEYWNYFSDAEQLLYPQE